MSDFYLIAGLGNPGARYAHNRHNIGFQTVEEFADHHHLSFSKSEHHAQTAHGHIQEHRVVLAKPQTWMNHSGRALSALANYYNVPAERILVIYDDLDIELGMVRYRQESGSGGHRGVQSIIQRLGTQAFPRLRLGIGRPPGRMDPADYVLQDFSADEEPIVWDVLRLTNQLIVDWLNDAPEFQQAGMTWRVAS